MKLNLTETLIYIHFSFVAKIICQNEYPNILINISYHRNIMNNIIIEKFLKYSMFYNY